MSFGKGFKERIGMLPEEKMEGPSLWKRVKTVTGYQYDLKVAIGGLISMAGGG